MTFGQGQFQPIDSLIDWTDPKWADVKDVADKFIYKGEHYIAPLSYSFIIIDAFGNVLDSIGKFCLFRFV